MDTILIVHLLMYDAVTMEELPFTDRFKSKKE